MSEYCPFVEKHRPNNFNDIVMTPFNKKVLTNIIETSYFPNLLFYGPPGTGKTTTIINLINAYQERLNNKDSGLMIHLNASDERGIDIIRNQILRYRKYGERISKSCQRKYNDYYIPKWSR